jgi:hypothetical protein
MSSPESPRSNFESARRIGLSTGMVKLWRSASESQVVKALILRAHYLETPRPTQRQMARKFHVSQPYVSNLIQKSQRVGIEQALGPESYEHFTAYRDAALHERNQSLATEWQRAIGTMPRSESPSSDPESSEPEKASAACAQQGPAPDGAKQYVECGRSMNGEVVEIQGSAPSWAPPASPSFQMKQPANNIPLNWVLDPRVSRCDLSLWLKAKH